VQVRLPLRGGILSGRCRAVSEYFKQGDREQTGEAKGSHGEGSGKAVSPY
jgi:hypothetical protein